MADEKAELAAKKVAELEKELDEYIESVEKKAEGKKREVEVTEENWEEEFEKVPAFMTKVPTQEEIDSNPALAALQAIKYEEENPIARTEAYKEDGNYHYKKKQFRDAIAAYTEGIKVKCDNDELNAILYTNRATAQWCLKNYRSAVHDATEARKLQPTYMKAILRGASACGELQKYDEALKWCDDGLSIEPQNKKLLDLRNKSAAEQKRILRDQRKATMKEKKKKSEAEALLSAVKARGVRLEHNGDLTRSISDGGLDVKVHLDTNGVLHWPVMFVYPEFNETDFISSFCENDRISDHLYTMFEDESPSWDVEKKYRPENLEVYFEDAVHEKLCLVKSSTCLKDTLSDSRQTAVYQYFQWADELPIDVYTQREAPMHQPRETVVDMLNAAPGWLGGQIIDNLLIQVTGDASPRDTTKLYLNGDKSEVLDIGNPDLTMYPKFAEATPPECFMEPGDVLFIPAMWFHNVISLQFGVAVNVFWRHLDPCYYDSKDTNSNKALVPVSRAMQIMYCAIKALEELPDEYRRVVCKVKVKCYSRKHENSFTGGVNGAIGAE